MSFPGYEKYKDSGVEWLGEVPGHWEVWKLGHAFGVIGSGTTPNSDNRAYYDGGEIPWINTGDLNDGDLFGCEKRVTEQAIAENSALRKYPSGSVIIAMYGATIGKLAILRFSAVVNQACCVFQSGTIISPKFLFYWLLAMRNRLISLATGGGQPNVNQEILRQLRVACPSLSEQLDITSFLDRETAKIDALVEEQRRLIALLKEKRQAVISHAVTKGLDPNAPMKDSAVEWLGEVPAHWEVLRIGSLFSEVTESGNDALPILSVSIHEGVSDREFEEEELDRKVTRSEDKTKYKAVSPNDLVFNMMRAWQGGFGTVEVRGMVSPAYIVARPTCNILTDFVELNLRTTQGIEEVRRHSKGITDFRLRLYWDEFKDIRIALPLLDEQIDILDLIKLECSQFDLLMTEAESGIALLQERRNALISAAVTGKIDVRGLASEEAKAA